MLQMLAGRRITSNGSVALEQIGHFRFQASQCFRATVGDCYPRASRCGGSVRLQFNIVGRTQRLGGNSRSYRVHKHSCGVFDWHQIEGLVDVPFYVSLVTRAGERRLFSAP
jgi:hypothetical protein